MKEQSRHTETEHSHPIVLLIHNGELNLRSLTDGTEQPIRLKLREKGIGLITAQDLEALEAFDLSRHPDIVVIGSPLITPQLEILRKIKDIAPQIPVVLLSSKPSEALEGFREGVADYQPNSLTAEELIARIKAILQRGEEKLLEKVVESGQVKVNLTRRIALVANERITLTRTEWALLAELAESAGKALPNRQLLDKVWGTDDNNVHKLIIRIGVLKRKIENDQNKVIECVPRIGYRFISSIA